jgi:pyridoxamine 5'-phosphate oxidase
MNIADLRVAYTKAGLLESDLHSDPVQQFSLWFSQAVEVCSGEPNAMALATVSAAGEPNCRMVLLKGFDAEGFVFFTNYASRKGEELAANPRATLLFYWAELERQVRIAGVVEPISSEESDAYFETRPEGHRLGAWASQQSAVVGGRDALEQAWADAARRFGSRIPRPPHWGGYRLRPSRFEFWQGRANRLHDRIEYVPCAANQWTTRRLAP